MGNSDKCNHVRYDERKEIFGNRINGGDLFSTAHEADDFLTVPSKWQ